MTGDTNDMASVLLVVSVIVTLAIAVLYYRNQSNNRAALLKNSEELLNNLEEGVYRSSMDGKQLSANPALVKLNGYQTEQQLLDAVGDIAVEWYVDPKRREEFSKQLRENGKITDFVSEIYRHNTRERIWISENARLVYNSRTGKPSHYEGTVRNITDVVAREEADHLLSNLTEKLPTGLFQLVRHADRTFSCPYVSAKFRELCGVPEDEEFQAQAFVDQIYQDDVEGYHESLRFSRSKMVDWDHEFRIQNANGEVEWYKIQATPEAGEDGSIVWHGHLDNVTERKNVEAQVNQLAYFDPLTGLSNRTHFLDELRQFLAAEQQSPSFAAMCFIDLDNFKLLNDSHGHGFGDKLLQSVAARLRTHIQPGDLLGRFGGDEFVLILKQLGSDEEQAQGKAGQITQKLLDEIERGFLIDGTECPMTMSLGVAMFARSPEVSISDLMKSADIAMYEAKRSGRNNMMFFDVDAQKSVADTYRLQRDIQIGLKENQFELELQPQIDRTGKIVCAETLSRWNHPKRGRIMPQQFISAAEQTGQIGHLNDWVLKQSVKLLSKWKDDPSLKNLKLSINISPVQMLDNGFVGDIEQLISDYEINPDRLMIELTEHVMARDPKCVSERMNQLRQLGICFSLDDFGTGYSSISQLRQFPFDELKIDGSFVADLTKKQETRSLVKAILNMADALGLKTVAEHVSTHEELDLLMELGCDLFQGYLFSRSLPIKDFEVFAKAQLPEDLVKEYRAMTA